MKDNSRKINWIKAIVINLVIAILQCFFGYKLLRFWTALVGFLIGFLLGFLITGAVAPSLSAYIPVLVGAAAGFVLSILAYKIYLAGVLVYCGIIAVSAVYSINFPEGQLMHFLKIVLMILAFLLAGVLAVKFARPCIIVISAVSGAGAAVGALITLSAKVSSDMNLQLVIFAAMAILGMVIQFLTTRKK
ncbi:MAG: hypothetical protein UHN88_01250 [Eubacterium sp.]|nr:hypothetical protein [Eubacterium sp.]